MDRKSNAQRTKNGNGALPATGFARRDKKRRGKVNLLSLLLRGRLRNASGVVLIFLGVVAVGAVILLLVALIAFVVQRSNDSLDLVGTPTATPVIGQRDLARTATPEIAVTITVLPTATATRVPPTPTEEAPMMVGEYVEVSGTGTLGLRLRSRAGLNAETTDVVAELTILKVLAGPQQVDDIEWWRLESKDGISGWAAGDFLDVTDEPSEGWE